MNVVISKVVVSIGTPRVSRRQQYFPTRRFRRGRTATLITLLVVRLWRYRVGAFESAEFNWTAKKSVRTLQLLLMRYHIVVVAQTYVSSSSFPKRKVYRAGPWENYATASLSPANTERIYCCVAQLCVRACVRYTRVTY